MNKPELIQSVSYYDLNEILDYVEESVPGFKGKIWNLLCDMGYIDNGVKRWIDFKGLIGESTPLEVVKGIEYIMDEFPYIKNGEVEFNIEW